MRERSDSWASAVGDLATTSGVATLCHWQAQCGTTSTYQAPAWLADALGSFPRGVSLARIEPVGFRVESDLRSN